MRLDTRQIVGSYSERPEDLQSSEEATESTAVTITFKKCNKTIISATEDAKNVAPFQTESTSYICRICYF